jgi:hypothetical protein
VGYRRAHAVTAVSVSHNSALIAASQFGGEVAIWDAHTGQRLCTPRIGGLYVYHCGFSHTGPHLATVNGAGLVGVWDVRTGAGRPLGNVKAPACCAWSPDDNMLAAVGRGGAKTIFRDLSGLFLSPKILVVVLADRRRRRRRLPVELWAWIGTEFSG